MRSIGISDTEQPGVGEAIGGVVGAAVGIAGGFEVGTMAASAVIPGVGPVLAVGIAAAALLGAGGAVSGAKIGAAAEERSAPGLPADEVFFYEDALRQGRSLIIVFANGKAEAARAGEILAQAGAESLDAAREAWWIGLRPAEDEHYRALGEVDRNPAAYRAGFEAALRREARGRSLDEVADRLKWQYPDYWDLKAFRSGFARGQSYLERHRPATSDTLPSNRA